MMRSFKAVSSPSFLSTHTSGDSDHSGTATSSSSSSSCSRGNLSRSCSSSSRDSPKRRLEIPVDFVCPLSAKVMHHPLMTPQGINFEGAVLLKRLSKNKNTTCPVTGQVLNDASALLPNQRLEARIAIWRHAQGLAKERIAVKDHTLILPCAQDHDDDKEPSESTEMPAQIWLDYSSEPILLA